jgi:hypothetical protein
VAAVSSLGRDEQIAPLVRCAAPTRIFEYLYTFPPRKASMAYEVVTSG